MSSGHQAGFRTSAICFHRISFVTLPKDTCILLLMFAISKQKIIKSPLGIHGQRYSEFSLVWLKMSSFES